MGTIFAGAMKAISCSDMWKYCCNSQHLKSRCCGEFCEVEYDTDMVPIGEESDVEAEIEFSDCCNARMAK